MMLYEYVVVTKVDDGEVPEVRNQGMMYGEDSEDVKLKVTYRDTLNPEEVDILVRPFCY